MEKYRVTIQVCSSCTKINAAIEGIETFCGAVHEQLRLRRDDYDWQVESTSCQKVCPVDRITITVVSSRNPSDRRLSVSKEASVEGVVHEALSFFRPKTDQNS